MKLKFLLVYFNVQSISLADLCHSFGGFKKIFFNSIYFAVNWISRLCSQSPQLITKKMDLLLTRQNSDTLQRIENKRKQPRQKSTLGHHWVRPARYVTAGRFMLGLSSSNLLAKWAAPEPGGIFCEMLSVILFRRKCTPG